MNPLASTKCAGRLLMALAAFTSILLIAGCSSSSKTPTNPKASRTLALQALMFFRRKAWIAADIRWPSRAQPQPTEPAVSRVAQLTL